MNERLNMGKKPNPDDKEQSQRFLETAHVLGVDETGNLFENALHVIQSSKSKLVTDGEKEHAEDKD